MRRKPEKTHDDLEEYLVARLVVRGIPDMSQTRRRWLAKWLREQADGIEKGKNYSATYTARYFR